LLILDVLMPGLNGIELATELRERLDDCKIIFLTGSPRFALDSYKVNAFYYLLKPFSTSELNTLIEKANNEIVEDNSNCLLLKEKGLLTKVKISDIKYIESNNHTIHFHLKNSRNISCSSPMNAYKDVLLSHEGFIKCHKSFLVNLHYVVSLSKSDFILEGDIHIPIGRNSLQSAKHSYLTYFNGKGKQ
jgi:DNA-binding LytR/AlgR family response regulator